MIVTKDSKKMKMKDTWKFISQVNFFFLSNFYLFHYKNLLKGEAFGELALLYNAPRAATIIAKTKSVLFALDRECFNHIVKDAA